MTNNFVTEFTEFNEFSENTFKKTSNGAKDGAPEVFVSRVACDPKAATKVTLTKPNIFFLFTFWHDTSIYTLGCKHLKTWDKGMARGSSRGWHGAVGVAKFWRGWGSKNCLVGAVPEIFWQNKLGCLVV